MFFLRIITIEGPDGIYHVDASALVKEESHPENLIGAIFVILLFMAPVIYWIIQYLYSRRNDHYWEAGVFPPNLKYNKTNLSEAYICLAARMIQGNTEDSGDKHLFLSKYMRQHFAGTSINLGESLSYSYRNPTKLHTVADWLNKTVKNRQERIRIMYFLAGLALIDGDMNTTEMAILRKMSQLLQLNSEEFESIISTYHARQEKQRQSQTNHATNTSYALSKCYALLGIPDGSSIEIVKKAYRKMAKLHHPDRYVNHSEEQQKLAEKRFIEIQRAYEMLEKNS